MKIITLVLTLTLLTGCSTITNLTKYIPKKYDPVMGGLLVDLKMDVDDLSCINSTDQTWASVQREARRLKEYAEFRRDPQVDNIAAAEKNLTSAKGKSQTLCENYVKIAKTRLKIVNQAWSTR